MKRVLSVLISAVIALSCFAGAFPVIAANSSAQVKAVYFYTEIDTIPEGVCVEYNETIQGMVYSLLENEGNVITIEYTDGSCVDYEYLYNPFEDEYGFYHIGTGYNLTPLENFSDPSVLYTDGDTKRDADDIEPNEMCSYRVWYNGVSSETYYFTVEENPIASVSYTMLEPVVEQRTNGYMGSDGIWSYNLLYVPGSITLTYKDPQRAAETYSYRQVPNAGYYNENGEKLPLVDVFSGVLFSTYDGYGEWDIGEHKFRICYCGIYSDECTLTVVENPISHIEYSPSVTEFNEGIDGYFSQEDGYNIYDVGYNLGDVLTVYYKDVAREPDVFEYRYGDSGTGFYNGDDYVSELNDLEVMKYYHDQHENKWSGGETRSYTVWYKGFESEPIEVYIVPSPIAAISFEPVVTVVQEGTFCYEQTDMYGEPYFEYNTGVWQIGDKLTVCYKDETLPEKTYTYSYNPFWGEGFFCDGELLPNSESVWAYDTQYYDHWSMLGIDYEYTVTYWGETCTATLTLISSSVESIEYYSEHEYTEGGNAWEDTEYIYDDELQDFVLFTYLRYNYEFYEGDILTVNYTDGSSFAYVYDGEECSFLPTGDSTDAPPIQMTNLYLSDEQIDNPWTVGGENNFFIVSYCGKKYTVDVTLQPNPIASIEYYPVKTGVIAGTEGYWNQFDSDEEFIYFLNFNEGDRLVVKYTDPKRADEEYVYCCNDTYGYTTFYNGDTPLEYEENLRIIDSQYDEPWTECGIPYEYRVSYFCKEDVATFTIYEAPVKSVKITTSCSCTQFTGGSFETFYDYNDNEEFWYHYNYSFCEGDVLTVEYTDGRTVKYAYDSMQQMFMPLQQYSGEEPISIHGMYVSMWDEQQEKPWEVGGENNYFWFSYYGVACKCFVEFNAAEVIEKAEFIAAKEKKAKEYTSGDYKYDWLIEDDFYYYDIELSDGDLIKFTYAGGEEKTYRFDSRCCDFVSVADENDVLRLGEEYRLDTNQTYENPFTKGENEFYICCFGQNIPVKFTVTSTVAERIEAKLTSPVVYFENFNGEFEDYLASDGTVKNAFFYNTDDLWLDVAEKCEITVYYDDGTSSTYAFNEWDYTLNNVENYNDYLDGVEISADQYSQPWTADGKNLVKITYGDCSDYVSVKLAKFLDDSYRAAVILDTGTGRDCGYFFKFRNNCTLYNISSLCATGFRTGDIMNIEGDGINAYEVVTVINGDVNRDGAADVLDVVEVERLFRSGGNFYEDYLNYAANGNFNDDIDIHSYQNTVNAALTA